VQELKSTIERAVALASDGDVVGPELVPLVLLGRFGRCVSRSAETEGLRAEHRTERSRS